MEGSHSTEGDRTVPVQFYRGARGFKPFKNPPQPHMCIQDAIKDTSEILYINVLSWKQIANTKQYTDPIPLYGGMQIPQGCAPNSNKAPLIVFAVMVNPEILKINGKHATNPMERDALVNLLCDFVEAMNPGLQLARSPIVLKDRDLAGELKDVWLAVQTRREREKIRNQESNSEITHKIYHIDGPSEPTAPKNDMDYNDYNNQYYDDEAARDNKIFRTDLKECGDKYMQNNPSIQISSPSQNINNSLNNQTCDLSEQILNEIMIMDKSQHERYDNSIIYNNEFHQTAQQKNTYEYQPQNKNDFRDLSFANKSGSLSNHSDFNISDINHHLSEIKTTSKPNPTMDANYSRKSNSFNVEEFPQQVSADSTSEPTISKNDKANQNGNKQSSPSHIPIKTSNVKRKNIVKPRDDTKSTNFYPTFDNSAHCQESTPTPATESKDHGVAKDITSENIVTDLNLVKHPSCTQISDNTQSVLSNKNSIDQNNKLQINGNDTKILLADPNVVGELLQNLNIAASAESAPSLSTVANPNERVFLSQ